MRLKQLIGITVYPGGDVHVNPYWNPSQNDPNVLGPFVVEFDAPPEVMRAIEQRKLEGEVKPVPTIAGKAESAQ